MKITEIFGVTLQGEGPLTGTPSVFIRTHGCIKPYCESCDSKYSWNTTNNEQLTTTQIINKLKNYNCNNIIITGGEPLMQKGTYLLISKLTKKGYTTQIETSGKTEITNKQIELIKKSIIICSPKQYNNEFIICPNIRRIADVFKFVIENEKEFNNMLKFIKEQNINKETQPIYLMPKTIDYGGSKDLAIKKFVWQKCCEHNFKYSARIHIDVWGQKRKV